MAVLPAPPIDWGGSNAPQAMSTTTGRLVLPNALVIGPTQFVLPSPAFGSLNNDPGIGYSS